MQRQAERARQIEEDDYKKNQSTYLAAIADVEDAPDNAPFDSSEDDLFGEIDKALALKRKEFVSQGLLQPNPPKQDQLPVAAVDELQPDELGDLEEIERLQGLTGDGNGSSTDSPFEFDFDSYGKSKVRIVEGKFKMTLAELLDESKVVPVSVSGDLEIEITGIQHDSRIVSSGVVSF